jgi:hypothetical protein
MTDPRPVTGTRHAPPGDLDGLLTAARIAVAEARAENDQLRRDLADAVDLVRRYTLAAATLRWSIDGASSDDARLALAALWAAWEDSREFLS